MKNTWWILIAYMVTWIVLISYALIERRRFKKEFEKRMCYFGSTD